MSSHRFLGLAAIVAVLLAAAAWVYRFRADGEMKGPKPKKVVLDLRLTAPIGYEFCVGKSHKGDDRPPERLPQDVYKHLDSGRLIAAHGEIHMEGDRPVLNVKLKMSEWPPGRYVLGISGDPFFGYCTMDFTDQ